MPPRGCDVLGRRQAGNYGFFYGGYYYPGNLDDLLPFGFKGGSLEVSNAPIPSVRRLICDHTLRSLKAEAKAPILL